MHPSPLTRIDVHHYHQQILAQWNASHSECDLVADAIISDEDLSTSSFSLLGIFPIDISSHVSSLTFQYTYENRMINEFPNKRFRVEGGVPH